ncbi:hypothetical protein TorRG33x02_072550 [Trema orientale]|uniref:Uncharacterized protein n=1 Tax=Trema orientale TaxID=63057 RepID=A0A2P5FGI9_TREOI|nr:hypothetical protein TorRG33x02_072550 [Trema orientale]
MRTEARCMELELEVERRKTEYQLLEAKFRALEAEKLATQEKLGALKRENDELKERLGCGNETKEDCGRPKTMEKVVDLTEDDWDDQDRVSQLMIENSVLECEKKKAERDVKAWENKFKELEFWILHSQKNLVSRGEPLALKTMEDKNKVVYLVDIDSVCHSPGKRVGDPKAAGSASNKTPYNGGHCIKEEAKSVYFESEVEFTAGRQARKQLAFEQESPSKKMAPSTPGSCRPASLSVVDIADSDEEPDSIHIQMPTDNQGSGKVVNPVDCSLGGSVTCEKGMTADIGLKRTNSLHNNVEDTAAFKEKIPLVSTPKRKRASNVVMSDTDTDNDSDDNIPIGRLKRMNLQEIGLNQKGSFENATASSAVANEKGTLTPPRRRLVALRKCRGKGRAKKNSPSNTAETKYGRGIPTNVDTEDDESDGVGSDSEGESLDGFIVNTDDSGGDDASGESEDHSDDKIDFSEILSNLQRKKDKSFKWEFEADMLAAFGKDTELCMKAVCALYRQQTSEEKITKGSLFYNNRGFNKFDALRGTTLAEFLTDGDAEGDMIKTEQELEDYDPKAIKLCRSLATNYSKQLFEIYKNKEDPFFLP